MLIWLKQRFPMSYGQLWRPTVLTLGIFTPENLDLRQKRIDKASDGGMEDGLPVLLHVKCRLIQAPGTRSPCIQSVRSCRASSGET